MRILVRDVTVIDGIGEGARPRMDVVVDGGRIASLDAHLPERVVPPGTGVVEGAGRTLLPGLIDAHAHYTFDPTEGSLQTIARRSDARIT